MKQEVRSILAAVASVLASLPWWWILASSFALLGSAGSVTATRVSGWLFWPLFCASILLLGRSFYVIYVRGMGTRTTTIIAWASLTFMGCFWTWYLTGGKAVLQQAFNGWLFSRSLRPAN
jgi:hypothetical protein